MDDKKYTDGMVLSTWFKTSQSGNKCLAIKCLLADGRTYYRDLVLIEKMNDRNIADVQAFTGVELDFVTEQTLADVHFGAKSFTLVEMTGRNGNPIEFINERKTWPPKAERTGSYKKSSQQTANPF